ncbi:MAG: HNH endonuclease [Phycisphaerales bacterium]|nr:HNH endonuclease [Phycisphaerales bacterium]
MSTAEYDDNAECALVACARHCCVCRRFRPTALQVHHIKERGAGGTDEYDNLIPVCLTCHSDVHTKRPFARRFTESELRKHRDQVYQMVSEGILVPPNELMAGPTQAFILQMSSGSSTPISRNALVPLSAQAAEVLVSMARGDGHLIFSAHMGGRDLRAGVFEEEIPHTNHRRAKELDAAIDELEKHRYIERTTYDRYARLYELTILGYTAADDLEAASSSQ